MKKRNKIYVSTAFFALLAMGCSNYLDVNQNPNTPVSSSPEYTLANALNVTAARLNGNEIGAFWSGQWSPSGSVSGFVPEKTYDIQTTFRTAAWTGPYDNLQDYKYVETEALKAKKFAVAGMARVMKAYNYEQIVDVYGNAPYRDALKGTASITPTYDTDSDIYDSLLLDIDKAKSYLAVTVDASNPSPGSADLYFAGSTQKWTRFANTLKLRLLIHMSGVSSKQAAAAAAITALGNAAGTYLGAGEDVISNPGYLKSTGKMNQWYENYGYNSGDKRAGNHDFYCYSDFFITSLTSTADTLRLAMLAYPTKSTGKKAWKGVPFGEGSDAYLYSKISGFGPALLPTDATVGTSDLYKRGQVIMTAAESYFLQAEAILKGYLPGGDVAAQAAYEAGIKESFRLLGAGSATAAQTYYNQNINGVSWSASASNKLSAIITQKWIALAGYNGLEAWTEFRRTGYPNVPLSTRQSSGGKQPVRLLYPLSEYSSNAANAPTGIDTFSSKIFWDVN